MVGTKHENVVHDELQKNPGSKFRRKLSNRLAFISFTQRKPTPAHRLPSDASAVSGSSTISSFTATQDARLSPPVTSASVKRTSETAALLQGTTEETRTPRQLPRSRTCSYIPRLTKIDGEAQNTSKPNDLNISSQKAGMPNSNPSFDSKPVSPTRIPTPSTPHSRRRVSSPRQYLHYNSASQSNLLSNRKITNGITDSTNNMPQTARRSHTTSNLTRAAMGPPTANYMSPRRPGARKAVASPMPQKPILAENIPTSKRATQRRSQIQERPVKRESLAVPSAASTRTTYRPSAPSTQGKHTSLIPSASAKRLSSHLSQASVSGIVTPTEAQEPDSRHQTVEQTVPISPERPPTPTLSTVDLTLRPPAPPNLNLGNDTQRRTLGTPNGLGGKWRSSDIFAAADHQVRNLPRSSTFHFFGRRSEAPPVPPVPVQYKSPSASNITHSGPQQYVSTSLSNFHHSLAMTSRNPESSDRSLLAEIASTVRYRDASLESTSTFTSAQESEIAEDSNRRSHLYRIRQVPRTPKRIAVSAHESSDLAGRNEFLSFSSLALPATQPAPTGTYSRKRSRTISTARPEYIFRELQTKRHWSISERFYPRTANNIFGAQVRDYMPPLYWAGRFQSRFDRWRTDAMVAVIHPDVRSEDEGPLGQCCLEEEREATILIFMQLRDLCASAQAADSLHVSPNSNIKQLVLLKSNDPRNSNTSTEKITICWTPPSSTSPRLYVRSMNKHPKVQSDELCGN